MGEAILYNRHTMTDIRYDWNAAFNNYEFIKKILKMIPPGPYTSDQLSILDYEYQEQYEMTIGYFPCCYQRIGSYAFERCTSLSYLYFSSSRYDMNASGSVIIYEIGENAFASCTSLQFITMSAIRKIGKRAFYNCTALRDFYAVSDQYGLLSMSYWMYSIDDEAFANCNYLAINNMNYVDRIGKSAFKNVKSYYFRIGNYICREIDDYAFENCINLSVILKNGSASDPYCRCSLGKHIFEGCTNLSYIEIHGGYDIYSDTFGDLHTCLKTIYFGPSYSLSMAVNQYHLSNSIGPHTFENYSLLSNVYISYVNVIGEYAFANCTSMQYCSAGFYQCGQINDYAFYGCTNLNGMFINENAFSFSPPLKMSLSGSNIFKNCTSLKSLYLYACVNVPSYLFKSCNGTQLSDLCIGNTYGSYSKNYGYYVSATIGKEAFAFCSTLQWVGTGTANIIEESAFFMCSNISTFYFGSWLCSEIQSNAFYGCSKISYLSFNTSYSYIQSANSVTLSIGDYAFANCQSLIYLELDNVKYLGSSILMGNHSIQNLIIKAASSYELELTSDILYGTLFSVCSLFSFKTIKSGAFNGQYKLSSIALFNCKNIDEYALQGCINLITFTAPTSEFSIIKTNLFSECSRLSSLITPSVLSIESHALESKSGLTDLTMFANTSIIGEYAFHDCANLQNIIIGPTYIGSHAFDGCSNLIIVNGPTGLISVHEYAFYNCSLYSGVFHFGYSTLEYVGSHAFDGCQSLSQIILTSVSAPPILESIDAFDNMNSEYIIIIPSTITEQFLNHSVWGLLSDHLMWTGKGE